MFYANETAFFEIIYMYVVESILCMKPLHWL